MCKYQAGTGVCRRCAAVMLPGWLHLCTYVCALPVGETCWPTALHPCSIHPATLTTTAAATSAQQQVRNQQSCRKKHRLLFVVRKSISGGASSTPQVPKCNPSKGSAAAPSATQAQPGALFQAGRRAHKQGEGPKSCKALEACVGQCAHSHDAHRNRAMMGWPPLAIMH